MKKTDGRKIDRKSREAIRKLAIQRIQAGDRAPQADRLLEVHGIHRKGGSFAPFQLALPELAWSEA